MPPSTPAPLCHSTLLRHHAFVPWHTIYYGFIHLPIHQQNTNTPKTILSYCAYRCYTNLLIFWWVQWLTCLFGMYFVNKSHRMCTFTVSASSTDAIQNKKRMIHSKEVCLPISKHINIVLLLTYLGKWYKDE